MNRKVEYVQQATNQDGKHHCHWLGCTKRVPPAMWGCKPHWFTLPKRLRDRIWQAYQPGQEISKTPSRDYIEAARAAQEWLLDQQISAPAQGSLSLSTAAGVSHAK